MYVKGNKIVFLVTFTSQRFIEGKELLLRPVTIWYLGSNAFEGNENVRTQTAMWLYSVPHKLPELLLIDAILEPLNRAEKVKELLFVNSEECFEDSMHVLLRLVRIVCASIGGHWKTPVAITSISSNDVYGFLSFINEPVRCETLMHAHVW